MAQVTTISHSGALTREDLELLRAGEDSVRYELLDGSVLVTPSPGRWHQTAVLRLAMLLDRMRPKHLVVMIAPFDVELAEDTVLQPDVLVARSAELTDTGLPAAPVLAVEVLSPSTRRIDLTLKLDRYRDAGCPSYWVVDPLQPSVTAWQLVGDAYEQVAAASGGDTVHLGAPFEVAITPAGLVSD